MRQVHDTIRTAVLRRLEQLDHAATADPGTLLPLARTEIVRIADGWRLLLTVHQRDEEGRCQACPTRIRGRRWPCQVWRTAYEQLIGDGVPHRARTRPLHNPIAKLARTVAARKAAELTVRFPAVPAD